MISIKISAKIYSGYTYRIEKKLFVILSDEEIIKLVKYDMEDFFGKHDLWILKDGIKDLKLHFHEDIKNITVDTIYLCDHKHD